VCEQWNAATATDVFLQLASGMKHLHSCGVLHRDLKTDNALIAGLLPLVVKWADFGVSVKLDGKGVASTYGGDGAGNFLVSPAAISLRIARPFCLPATPALQCVCVCVCVCICVCARVYVCVLPMARVAEDRTYTDLKAPTAWRAPETFLSRAAGKVGSVASTASDVFMLGCCFLELATGCTRTPYDWLYGESLLVYRGHDSTRAVGPIQVTLLPLIVVVVAL
jgi:serine/threonine protein kinase